MTCFMIDHETNFACVSSTTDSAWALCRFINVIVLYDYILVINSHHFFISKSSHLITSSIHSSVKISNIWVLSRPPCVKFLMSFFRGELNHIFIILKNASSSI